MNNLDKPTSRKDESKYQKLCQKLIRTNNWLVKQMQDVFKENGLTLQQFNLLKILQNHSPEPCSVHFLKNEMPDQQSDVSRLVARLHAKKLVVRKSSPEDRRKTCAYLTPEGKKVLKEVQDQLQGYEIFFPHLQEQEIDRITQMLDKIRFPSTA
jgi:MarR family multiple gene transcriptional regulator MgrA